MFNVVNGTSVPKSLDFPEKGGDFKVNPESPPTKPPSKSAATKQKPQKSPIMAVSMRPLPSFEFEVTIARQYKNVKVYSIGFHSANRLVNAVNKLRYKGKVQVCPGIVGWTAFLEIPLEGPVCPPPETDTLIVPGIGIVPIAGKIVPDDQLGNRVEWGVS